MRTVLVVVLLLVTGSARAQAPIVYEVVTFAGTSIGFAAAGVVLTTTPPMTSCQGVLETAQIRIRYDGTAPTSTEGEPVEVGSVITIGGFDKMQLFRGIRTTGTSGVIRWHCQR